MKIKAVVHTLGFVAAAFAMQDAVTFARSYKEGDKDTFKLNVTASMSVGAAEVSMNMTQTVKKVYENGDADVESQVADMKVSFNGQEMPTGGNEVPVNTQRVDKFGRSIGEAQGGNQMMNQMSFMRYAGFMGDKPLKLGESVDVDTKDEKTGSRVFGTVKLDKLEAGVATVISNLKVTTKETGETKPMKMNFVTLLDSATAKINKVSGDISELPAGDQGMTVDSVKLVMERNK